MDRRETDISHLVRTESVTLISVANLQTVLTVEIFCAAGLNICVRHLHFRNCSKYQNQLYWPNMWTHTRNLTVLHTNRHTAVVNADLQMIVLFFKKKIVSKWRLYVSPGNYSFQWLTFLRTTLITFYWIPSKFSIDIFNEYEQTGVNWNLTGE